METSSLSPTPVSLPTAAYAGTSGVSATHPASSTTGSANSLGSSALPAGNAGSGQAGALNGNVAPPSAISYPDASASPTALKQAPPRSVRHEDSAVLKLKGLPYSTTEQQIFDFFSGFKMTKVAFVYEPDGRPSGLAFAEFDNREEALRAMAKNGEYIGERYVRLLHVPKSEMEEQVKLGTLAIPGQANKMRQRLLRTGLAQPAFMMDPLQQLQLQAQQPYGPVRPMMDMQQMYGSSAGQGGGMVGQDLSGGLSNGGGGHTPPGLPPHLALVYQLNALSLGGPPRPPSLPAPMMQHPGAGMLSPGGAGLLSPGGGGMLSPGGGGGGGLMSPGAGGGYLPSVSAPSALSPPPMAVIGTDSKTLKIRGLPFRATPMDILGFFDGYDYIAESLQLGVDALGRPSGEAWLTFTAAEEALRAVRERNRHYLGNRYLELSLT